MVNNIFKLLDEGEIKNLPLIDYNMTITDYHKLCVTKSNRTVCIKGELDPISLEYKLEKIHNPDYKEPTVQIRYAMKKMDEINDNLLTYNANKGNKTWSVNTQQRNTRFFANAGGEQAVYDYLEIIPFTPSVMINISP